MGIGLFASAFSPVLVALALVTWPFASTAFNILLLVLCALPAAMVGLTLRAAARLQDNRVRYAKLRRTDRDVLTFMASYVLPIATAFFAADAARWAATGILLLLLIVIYVRGQLFQLNPVLAVLGYRLFELESDEGAFVTVLSRRRSLPQHSLLAKRFSDELYIDFERDA